MMETQQLDTIKVLNVTASDSKSYQLIFKKHKNKNEYLQVENFWIRNMFGKTGKPVDINKLYNEYELKEILDNEVRNSKMNFLTVEPDIFECDDVLIVSDGFGFDQLKDIEKIRQNVCIISINHATRFWSSPTYPNFMLINHPKSDAMSFLPNKIFPRLLASRRTYTQFLKSYKNHVLLYDPVPEEYYQSIISAESIIHIDDYRNPVCGAIGFAKLLQAKNIYLAFCSSAYRESRPGTTQVEEGIHQYPLQITADKIVDANLFWYKFANRSAKIFHCGYEKSFKFSKYLKFDEFVRELI